VEKNYAAEKRERPRVEGAFKRAEDVAYEIIRKTEKEKQ
jgi:hypothetical protein